MSFGFGVGDFIAVGGLACRLYSDWYPLYRGAPKEIQLLVNELGTLRMTIDILTEELKDPKSTLVNAGEPRRKAAAEMIGRIEETLEKLDQFSKKYLKIIKPGRANWRKQFDKFKYSLDASGLDVLRSRLCYHNGVMNLLLTSAGNSSLERIESTAQKVESDVSEIKALLRTSSFSTRLPSNLSGFDIGPGDSVLTPSLARALMKKAEVSRRWSEIGIHDWIGAGRWWLLKARVGLHSTVKGAVSTRPYMNLVKSSWILVEVIVRHPQLNYVESDVGYEVKILAATIKKEFERLKTLNLDVPDLEKNAPEPIDLEVWETREKGPNIQPGTRSDDNVWVADHEQIYFQRFAMYQPVNYKFPAPCLVLLFGHKMEPKARVIIYDQSWSNLAEVPVEQIRNNTDMLHFRHSLAGSLEFPEPDDMDLLCVIFEAFSEYLTRYTKLPNEPQTIHALALLVAIKRGMLTNDFQVLLRENESDCNTDPGLYELVKGTCLKPDPIPGEESSKQSTSPQAQTRISNGAGLPGYEGNSCVILSSSLKLSRGGFEMANLQWPRLKEQQDRSLLVWLALHGYSSAAALLIKVRGIPLDHQDNSLLLYMLSPTRAFERVDYPVVTLLLEEGLDPSRCFPGAIPEARSLDPSRRFSGTKETTKLTISISLLAEASWIGNVDIVKALLRNGAVVYADGDLDPPPLLVAASRGYMPIIYALLKEDANLNFIWMGKTVLQLALAHGFADSVDVERMLKMGAKVNVSRHITELQAAFQGMLKEDTRIIRLLLDAGADVNAIGVYPLETPLQAAAGRGHIAILRLLIDAGANIETITSAVKAAVAGGFESATKLLLDAGADVTPKFSKNGKIALNASVAGGFESVTKILVDAGAVFGANSLQIAAARGFEPMVKMILDAGVNLNDKKMTAALISAVVGGFESITKILLNAGAGVNIYVEYRGTALQNAARGGSESIVKILLDAGADVLSQGVGALFAASEGGFESVVRILLKSGADRHLCTHKGDSALKAAAAGGFDSIVEMLLKAGAAVNYIISRFDNAPLEVAASGGFESITKRLLDSGADVNCTGYTYVALQGAAKGGYVSIVRLLLDAGATVNTNNGKATALQEAAAGGFDSIVDSLLDAGATVQASNDYYERTALHAAAAGGFESIVKKLLDAGADANANYRRSTVLREAAKGGFLSVVRMLIEAGAKVNDGPLWEYGSDALQEAAGGGFDSVVKLLLDAGAIVNSQTSEYGSALERAIAGGYESVVKMLLDAGADPDGV